MDGSFSFEQLQLSKRNHGFLLEALRYPLTPPGLHYTLVHYDVPAVDAAAWRLSIGGLVERPFELGYSELRALPAVETPVTLECAGNGRSGITPAVPSVQWHDEAIGTAAWTGARLSPLLERAGLRDGAVEIVFSASDRGLEDEVEQCYARSLTVQQALEGDVLLAYEMNGAPLPPQHGYPVRLVVPGWYGMASVKWLTSIEAVGAPFQGHQQAVAYRLSHAAGEAGEPVTRILPRALMVPPGIPDFFDRRRTVDLGECRLEGRAWSGHAEVTSVEVSLDGGESWNEAAIERDVDSRWAWRRWTYLWEPELAGEYELCCRARDAAGNTQPDTVIPNLGGYCNNAVQRVAVTVRPRPD
jgi:DMSO/TMAO reductase YedYZ molybdopterin-dependent catalytic subunit